MKKKTLRTLKGAVDTANVRLARLKGEEHVVFPVVAMVGDIVIYHMTSDGTKNGEFIPAEALSDLSSKWNDTMVVPDHPTDADGAPTSASNPDIATSMSYGRVYNAQYSKGALRWEIWLSSARADIVGLGAPEAIASAQKGEIVENSISFYSFMEEIEGTSPDGTPYSFKHHDLVPEHFAFGLNGAKGACSVADGCGGPRVASAIPGLKPRSRVLRAAASKDENAALRLLRRAYHSMADLGVSDSDLRREIGAQLAATVPGFDWVRAVFQETSVVIYEVFLLGQFTLWQQSYIRSNEGIISLVDDAQEVVEKQPPSEFVPVPVATSEGNTNNSQESEPDLELERTNMKEEELKALVQKVIANKANCFTAEYEESLLKTEHNILTAMAGTPESATEPAAAPTAAAEPCGCEVTPADPATPPQQALSAPDGVVLLSAEDHTRLMASLKESDDLKAAQRDTLIAAVIVANPALTKDDLDPMSLSGLIKMAPKQQPSGPVDYSLLGGPMPVATSEPEIPLAAKLSEQMKPTAKEAVVN